MTRSRQTLVLPRQFRRHRFVLPKVFLSAGDIGRLRISSVILAGDTVAARRQWADISREGRGVRDAVRPIWRVTTSRKLDRWRGTAGATRVHLDDKGGRYRCYRAPSAIVLSTRRGRAYFPLALERNFATRTSTHGINHIITRQRCRNRRAEAITTAKLNVESWTPTTARSSRIARVPLQCRGYSGRNSIWIERKRFVTNLECFQTT